MHPFLSPLTDEYSEPSPSVPERKAPEVDEREALDAYSRVIVTVAEKLGPAVVNLRAVAADGGRAPGRIGIGVSDHARWISPDESPRRPRLEPDAGSAQ